MALGTPLPLLLSTVGDYEIDRSLRFNKSDSAYLNMTPPSDGSMTTWTFSCWVKRGSLRQNYNSHHYIFQACPEDGKRTALYWMQGDSATASDADCLTFQYYGGSGGTNYHKTTTAKYRDVAGWYHIVAVWDTTNGTAGDRMRLWVNGSRITSWVHNIGDPPQHQASHVNDASYVHSIGRRTHNTDNYLDGYLAEVNFVDGQALDASSFGETNEDTGQWIPKKYAGAYGDEGFYLKFDDNSGTTATTLGKDSSGNSNNWTPNNFSVAAGTGNDSLADTPTNNYPTLNSVDGYSTLSYEPSNGNLDYNISDTSAIPYSTIAVPNSGKWYAEFTAADIESGCFGLKPIEDFGLFSKGYLYTYHGKIWKDNSETQTVAAISDGDVIGVAVDRTAQTVQFSKNGTNIGSTEALVADQEYKYWIARYASSGGSPQGSVNFGQRAFSHQPSGFKGLCTSELPTPTIKKPTDYFNTVLYTGNGAVKTVTGAGFQPDLLINKRRDSANVTLVVDSGIGTAYGRSTALTDEDWASNVTLNSDGFVTANTASSAINHNGGTYVSHFWKESASAGFDIVTYTGTGSNPQTRAHSLGVAPEMIILKNRSGTNDDEHWAIYHHKSNATPEDYWARMNTTGAFEDLEMWNDTAPTSSVFTTQNHAISNYNGDTFVAYLFSSVEGYSKAGGYSGNGNANGVFVYLGFKPAFLLIKCTNSAESWEIYDNKRLGHNVNNESFFPDLDNAESSEDRVDLLSNGFKARINSGGINGSSKDYIYLAFAETPFKYATAR